MNKEDREQGAPSAEGAGSAMACPINPAVVRR